MLRPLHFDAEYGKHEVLVSIATLAVIAGTLPRRALGMVTEWASLRQAELRAGWRKVKNLEPVSRIDPLP